MYQGTASDVPLGPFIFVIPTEPAAAGERRDLLLLSLQGIFLQPVQPCRNGSTMAWNSAPERPIFARVKP